MYIWHRLETRYRADVPLQGPVSSRLLNPDSRWCSHDCKGIDKFVISEGLLTSILGIIRFNIHNLLRKNYVPQSTDSD
jgi:hypothetical protein